MLADEVTHVKMGLRLAASSHRERPERRAQAWSSVGRRQVCSPKGDAFGKQRVVSSGLARRFRELAGFTPEESTKWPRSASIR